MARQPLYAVSLYPERTKKIAGASVSGRLLAAYVRSNHDLLGDPRNNVGLWYTPQQNITYLDVTVI
ncbi:MAG: hypothetical protein JO250_18150 [Armatimonadetes bacterium]|nr:hypothetical protein [Armatimonadota bacterium]